MEIHGIVVFLNHVQGISENTSLKMKLLLLNIITVYNVKC